MQQLSSDKALADKGLVVWAVNSQETAEKVQAFLKRVRAGCRAQQIDYLTIRTDQPLDTVLTAFLSARKKRVK